MGLMTDVLTDPIATAEVFVVGLSRICSFSCRCLLSLRVQLDLATTHTADVSSSKTMEFLYMVILGGGFKYVLFSPLPGEMIQFD